jgi:hypothetical protein
MFATPTDASSAIAQLNLALRRWERLSARPARLEYPFVADLARALRVVARLRDRGQHSSADELAEQCAAEYDRMDRIAKWSGRSAAAWAAMAARLELAIAAAVDLAGLAGDQLQYALDRLHDAEGQALWQAHWQSLN